MNKSSPKFILPDIFHRASRTTLAGVDGIILNLDPKLSKANLTQLFDELLALDDVPALELILSSATAPVAQWVMSAFPATIGLENYSSTVWYRALTHLADFCYFHDLTAGAESGFDPRKQHKTIHSATDALTLLSSIHFDDPFEAQFCDPDEIPLKVKPKSQRSKKLAKRKLRENQAPRSSLDYYNFFAATSEEIPANQAEVDQLETTILNQQRDIFISYIDVLRQAENALAIKTMCIDRPTEQAVVEAPEQLVETAILQGNDASPNDLDQAVHPMKAALHFDSIEGFGEWKVYISGSADKSLRDNSKKNPTLFNIIIKKIKELSMGHFSDDNQKRLTGAATEIPIYEAKMTRDSRLVYQIDCILDHATELDTQVIRIFGIYTHAQLGHSKLWDSISHQMGKAGKEYKRRCTFRVTPKVPGDKVFSPASFPAREVIEELEADCLDLPKEDLDELHSLLMLGKFVSFSQPLLNSILADLDVAFPYDVSPEEMKIINHPLSCYVLGRSGTGKTTTMLFKMVCIESTFKLGHAAGRHPRQLFVTQSRVLAAKVSEYYGKLSSFLESASHTLQELQVLAGQKRTDMATPKSLRDQEEEGEWNRDLPSRFSLLTDEHFPLFLTHDKLCKLLEADFIHGQVGSTGPDNHFRSWGGSFVSYRRFLQEYWSHFPQALTKGLDPALVFSEFMGVLKGSSKALGSRDNHINRQAYIDLGHRSFSMFAEQRNIIFDIFTAYTRRKRLNDDFDAADRTQAILHGIRHNDVPGRKVDYIYVDEVQDNLLIDTLVLRSICSNPEGLFWAGDTAQTISIGSSFRFNELKAFQFSIEQKAAGQKLRTRKVPEVFQLAVNYRSHGGIVDCAHSVIELIEKFWPNTIDKLKPERGVIAGCKPVFIIGWDEDTIRYEQFLFGDVGNPVEFGAQQCILVRDEDARARLRKQVGDIGIIMTLYESKGSEFNDVLLYNFFEDSSVDLSRWRVVLNAIDDERAPDVAARHVSVCSELKCLYVAITRARKNVWIADCSEKGEPMRKLWSAKGLIQNCTPNDVPTLAVASTAEEWEVQGRSLFENRKFFQAKHCFERALLPLETAVAHAYFLREEARKLPINSKHKSDIDNRKSAYSQAAESFLRVAQSTPNSVDQIQYYRNAATCYEDSGEYILAAEAYVSAAEYTPACKLYRKHAAFGAAVDLINMYGEEIDAQVVENILDVARLYYLTKHNLECSLGYKSCSSEEEQCTTFGKANALFSSPDEQLEYLEDRDLDLARATFLMTLPGKLAEAAEIHLAEGRTLQAIQLFLKDKHDPGSLHKATRSILQGLWHHVSFNASFEEADPVVHNLIELARGQNLALRDPSECQEIEMFLEFHASATARSEARFSRIRELGIYFHKRNNNAAALLSLHFCFSAHQLRLHSLSLAEMTTVLSQFGHYVELLHQVVSIRDLCRSQAVQKLFAFTPANENLTSVRGRSFLHSLILHHSAYILEANGNDVIVSNPVVERVLRHALARLLHKCILDMDDACRQAAAFTPCLPYAVFEKCQRPEEHVKRTAITSVYYNQRIRAHLLQITTLNVLSSVEPGNSLLSRKKYWLSKLFDAIYPSFHSLGSVSLLNAASIPEYAQAMSVVIQWTRAEVYNLGHDWNSSRSFLTSLIRGATIAFSFDRSNAPNYIYQARCITEIDRRPQEYFRSRSQSYIVPEFLASLQGFTRWSISGGVLFVQHIILTQIPVNISLLLNFAEFICSSLIVYDRLSRVGGIHQVILPLGWLSVGLQVDPWSVDYKTKHLFGIFADALGTLLAPVFTGQNAEHLLHSQRDLGTLSYMHRHIYASRICRILGFFGLKTLLSTHSARKFFGTYDPCTNLRSVSVGS